MFATVTVAVCHCGAGCVLGDVIGEWLVYGTGATINGESLWVAYLVGGSSRPLKIIALSADMSSQISPSPSRSASFFNITPSHL